MPEKLTTGCLGSRVTPRHGISLDSPTLGRISWHLVVFTMSFLLQVNWREFGDVLKARGPYLVYHNEHSERTVAKQHDTFRNNPDTEFHPGEFKELVGKAMRLAEQIGRGSKEEL